MAIERAVRIAWPIQGSPGEGAQLRPLTTQPGAGRVAWSTRTRARTFSRWVADRASPRCWRARPRARRQHVFRRIGLGESTSGGRGAPAHGIPRLALFFCSIPSFPINPRSVATKQCGNAWPGFPRHGYVFLYLFRHGVGTSSDQGANAFDLMNKESAEHGQEARNTLQLRLLENRDMDDALSGLKFLRSLPYVDSRNIGLVGHSFGGSLTVLLAEREPNLRAVVSSPAPDIALIALRRCERACSPPLAASRLRSSSFTLRTITPSRPAKCWTPAATKSGNRIV